MAPPVSKEQQILERQRLLAARMNKASSGTSTIASSSTASKKPAPPAARKRPSTFNNNNSKKAAAAAAAAAGDGASQQPKSKQPPSAPAATASSQQPKRPTLKRPTRAPHSASAVLAAARARAATSSSSTSTTATSKNTTTNETAKSATSMSAPPREDKKPSPRVVRKVKIGVASSSSSTAAALLTGSSSLAKLVKNASTINGDPNDDALAQSLRVHEPDDFWKNLRDWDLPSQYYFEQQQQQQQSQQKPNSNATDQAATTTAIPTKRPLPDTFLNPRHYIAAWAPLCLAECRAQLLQELLQNMTAPVLVEVQSTSSRVRHRPNSAYSGQGNDAPWLEENETGGYVMVHPKQRVGGDMNFMANDLVLLLQPRHKHLLRDIGRNSAAPPQGTDPESMNAFANTSLIGHTESSRRELNGLILKVSKRKWAVVGQKEMYLVKIGSNVTALREYTALCSVDTLPMKQFLLGQHLEQAEHRRKLSRNQPIEQLLQQMGGEQLGDGFLQYAKNKFNPSQITAIAAAAHEYGEGGFTLIKGPPGTGKTTTLCAVLNSLHIRQYNKYYDEVRRIATKLTGTRETALAMARRAKPRLLVCAPSNAAIDNIILKIMEDGFIDGRGQRYNPSMIRVGVGQSAAVRPVALEEKVETIFSENSDAQQLQSSIAGYRAELSRIMNELVSLRRRAHAIETASPWPVSSDWEIRIDEDAFEQTGKAYFVNHQQKQTTYEVPPPPEPGAEQWKTTSMPEYRSYVSRIVKLVESYFSMKTHLERCTIVQASMNSGANQFDVRLNLEAHVLNSVHMVMTTLGTAGNRTLEAADRFEVIVVDEAAQSVEPASLSALRLGNRHAVLVGDPQQLPATIFNVSGRNSKYDRSLFQRMEEAGQPVYMLNEQYRMHPKISHFPRHIFYQGALLDGVNVKQPDYGDPLRSIVCRAVPTFSPFMILDLDSKEERGGTSLSNLSEAKLACYLYEQLNVLSRGVSTSSKVAVITPYAQQCRLLRSSFNDLLGPRYEDAVEINTVDAFQGREANIVIFSAVRAAGSRGIGFLSDVRRMNVALTRAKHFLFVIARCESIVVNPYWFDLVQHARETNAVVRVPMLGSGVTASFGNLSSWQPESPVIGVPVSASNAVATAPKDPRKGPEDPRKRKKTHPPHTTR